MKIGIIGMGVAGISILREISKQIKPAARSELKIVVFSDAAQTGTGFPYQFDDESLLINQYTETMTIKPDAPNDFADWIRKNKTSQSIYHSHLPRSWFGEYLNQTMNEWINDLDIEIIREKAEHIDVLSDGRYTISSGKSETVVDFLHLTVGHLAYQDPYHLKGEKGFIYNPYPASEKINIEKQNRSVAIIGTGLTALDVMLYISKTYPLADITFYSRDGLFSSVRGHEPSVKLNYFCQEKVNDLLFDGQDITLDLVKKWFFSEMKEHGINVEWVWGNLGKGSIEGMALDLKYSDLLGEFQSLIRHMRKCYPIIWGALPDNEKDLFLKEYGSQWQRFKAPIPQKTAEDLIMKLSTNELGLVKGLKAISKSGNQFVLTGENDETYQADYVINCTGQDVDLVRSLPMQDTLIRHLVNKKIVKPHQYGGIAIDYPSMSIIDGKNTINPTFKAYGQIVSGVQYGNNNVELISLSARYGVKSMVDKLNVTAEIQN